MEESLKSDNFDAKNWLHINLELTRPDSLDMQLTELNINLSLLKSQLE